MQILRKTCQQYSKWKPLEDYILRIETYLENDGVFVLENCKALIECICKTILEDVGEACSRSDSVQALISKACNQMSCLPETGNLVRSFHTVAQRLGEFRNEFATTGHGSSVYDIDQYKTNVTRAASAFMVTTVEQLAIFLLTVYHEEYPLNAKQELRYIDNPEFNHEFDEELEPIQIGNYGPYSPSELLFNIDIDAYKTALAENATEEL